jgi:putative oxidoreductase
MHQLIAGRGLLPGGVLRLSSGLTATSSQESRMIDPRTAPYGALLLRITLGALLIVHFLNKLLIFTPAGTAHMFVGLGLPGELAYLIMTIEITTGIALIVGFWPRWAALAALPVLIGAVVFFHAKNGFAYNAPKGGGWEYPAFWAVALLVQVLIGDGAYALRPSPRWKT